MAISRRWATSSVPRALALTGALLALASACRTQLPEQDPAPVPANAASAPGGAGVPSPFVASAEDGAIATAGDAALLEPGAAAAADDAPPLAHETGDAPAAGDDAPLPALEEVPAFLAPAGVAADRALPIPQAGAAPSAGDGALSTPPAGVATSPSRALPAPRLDGDDSLDSLMRQVRLEDDGSEEEGSFASVVDADPPATAPLPPWTAEPGLPGGAIGRKVDGEAAGATEPAGKAEPCADLLARIDARQDFLRRVAVERDSFAYVENEADATALRLLAAMRRCAEHPGDEDCQAPAMEVDLRDVEPPRHQFEVWPTDLEAEHKDPDEVPQDPQIRELQHQLEACRRRHTPQPLLDRHAGD